MYEVADQHATRVPGMKTDHDQMPAWLLLLRGSKSPLGLSGESESRLRQLFDGALHGGVAHQVQIEPKAVLVDALGQFFHHNHELGHALRTWGLRLVFRRCRRRCAPKPVAALAYSLYGMYPYS